jgi:hypothetical protein
MIVHSQSMAIGDLRNRMLADGPMVGGQRVPPSLHGFVHRFCMACKEGCNITQIMKRVSMQYDELMNNMTLWCESYEEKN